MKIRSLKMALDSCRIIHECFFGHIYLQLHYGNKHQESTLNLTALSVSPMNPAAQLPSNLQTSPDIIHSLILKSNFAVTDDG